MTEQEQFVNQSLRLSKRVYSMSEGAAKVALFCALLTMEIWGDEALKELYAKTCETYTEASQKAVGRA